LFVAGGGAETGTKPEFRRKSGWQADSGLLDVTVWFYDSCSVFRRQYVGVEQIMLTRAAKINSTVSPGTALTVFGEKVIVLFAPTRTWMFMEWTVVSK